MLTLHGPSGARRGTALENLALVQDGSVLIKDGLIAAVGSTRRLENLKEAREALDIDIHGSVVLPGFVDPGLRVTFKSLNPPDRNSAPERPRRVGQLYDDTLNLLRSCMQHGTLIAEVKGSAGFPEFRSDLSVLRRLGKIGNNPVEMLRTWQVAKLPRTHEEFEEFQTVLDRATARDLIHFIEITASEDDCPDSQLLESIAAAKVRIKLCWNGGSAEALRSTLQQCRPVSVTCVNDIPAEHAAVLGESSAIAIFSPGRQLEWAVGPGLGRVIEAGGAIALASGYDAAESPAFSMQMAVSLAVIRERLPLEAALVASTINAAHAVGCGGFSGTLEVGKRADILVLSVPDYREIPRQFGINHVGMVLRDGAVVLNRSRWKIGAHEPLTGRVRAQHIGGA